MEEEVKLEEFKPRMQQAKDAVRIDEQQVIFGGLPIKGRIRAPVIKSVYEDRPIIK